MAVLAYVDVQLFAILATKIKASFRLSDTRLGVLQGLALNLSYQRSRSFPLDCWSTSSVE